ncbi:MAG: hypothetical protein JWQ75_556 [Pseudarthrobacter sp.]|nr:hypothetical protein [Pseudarthrobacter sp.]
MSIHPLRPRGPSHEQPDIPPLLCLVVGGQYVHCGQPMQPAGSEIRRLYATSYTDLDPADAVDLNLKARVLRVPAVSRLRLPPS